MVLVLVPYRRFFVLFDIDDTTLDYFALICVNAKKKMRLMKNFQEFEFEFEFELVFY